MRVLRTAIVVAGVAVGVAAEASSYLPGDASAVGDFAVGMAFVIGAALVVRRSTPMACLFAATGFTWFAGGLAGALVFLHRGPLVQLLLGYPRGRLESRLARALVAVAYVDGAVYALGRSHLLTLVLLGAVLVAAGRRWARAYGPERRARGAALSALLAVAAVLGIAEIARASGAGVSSDTFLWAYEIVLVLAAAGLTADLLSGRWARAAVTGLVADLGDLEREATLQARLARSVGDPSLVLGFWEGDGGEYVDESGHPIDAQAPRSGRSALLIRDDAGHPAAAILHDPAVLDDPVLAKAVEAAVRIAVANVRLKAQVLAKVEEVRTSRRRLVEAADAERRRLEAELRRVSEPQLRLVEGLLAGAGAGYEEASLELQAVEAELQELARGIHPRALTELGLGAALAELAPRFPFPVHVDVPEQPLPPAVAAAAYFVASEGVANAAKHSGAGTVWITAAHRDGRLSIEVTDDGRGGADIEAGSGLRGLADRVEALGGRLLVEAAPEGGTRLRAEIPLNDEVGSPEPLAAGASA
jgi:signal transduction histidine kinase